MRNFEKVDTRDGYDMHGKIIHMVTSGGYVMVKRPRCMPFVLPLKVWARVPKNPTDGDDVSFQGYEVLP